METWLMAVLLHNKGTGFIMRIMEIIIAYTIFNVPVYKFAMCVRICEPLVSKLDYTITCKNVSFYCLFETSEPSRCFFIKPIRSFQ